MIMFIFILVSLIIFFIQKETRDGLSKNSQETNLKNKPTTELKSKSTMILVCFFFGGLGIHRLMMGYSNWWLQLITLGGFGIWSFIDFIRLITGDMKMSDGRDLV